MSHYLDEKLRLLLSELEKKANPQQFYTWFSSLKLKKTDDSEIILEVPNAFHKEQLQKNYADIIEQAVMNVFGEKRSINFVIGSESRREFESRLSDDIQPNHSNCQLNKDYIFENFIVGPNNRLAHAASIAVAESPGRAYNPLFLHSSIGLGKTHLLQAVCHFLLNKKLRINIFYISWLLECPYFYCRHNQWIIYSQ